ncbi:hypothetical protein DPMN_191618 [Dreissena polymorpha]|uniref:Uncharacterized protein n=1 Tax=Dreissena polymorpha TaxID=45954 RepID=A0A9D3Y1L6_DREPO|nr:hypothetical protein DPMN_191618 [Dreissena polymorpha]
MSCENGSSAICSKCSCRPACTSVNSGMEQHCPLIIPVYTLCDFIADSLADQSAGMRRLVWSYTGSI